MKYILRRYFLIKYSLRKYFMRKYNKKFVKKGKSRKEYNYRLKREKNNINNNKKLAGY